MSAIIGSLIPKIEGFQPIPNAVMIPFMEAQSAALAYGFGLNYEYGKRKIRSMSNDEFNSLTSVQITNMSNEHTHIILSQFQAQVPKVMPMQTEIFKQYVIIEKAKVQQNFELAKWMLAFIKEISDDTVAHLMGGHLHGEILEPFVTDPDSFINPKTGEQGAKKTPKPTPAPPPIPTPNIGTTRKQTSDEKAMVKWQSDLFEFQNAFDGNQRKIDSGIGNWQKYYNRMLSQQTIIARFAKDFRHPNNEIRQAALFLRQQIANGRWSRRKQ